MRMNERGWLAFVVVTLYCHRAFGAGTIEVASSPDTEALYQLAPVMLAAVIPCEQKFGNDMKQNGKTDQEIRDSGLEQKCHCMNKGALADGLKKYDAINSKHPDWRGKRVIAKKGEAKIGGAEPSIFEKIRQDLKNCP